MLQNRHIYTYIQIDRQVRGRRDRGVQMCCYTVNLLTFCKDKSAKTIEYLTMPDVQKITAVCVSWHMLLNFTIS